MNRIFFAAALFSLWVMLSPDNVRAEIGLGNQCIIDAGTYGESGTCFWDCSKNGAYKNVLYPAGDSRNDCPLAPSSSTQSQCCSKLPATNVPPDTTTSTTTTADESGKACVGFSSETAGSCLGSGIACPTSRPNGELSTGACTAPDICCVAPVTGTQASGSAVVSEVGGSCEGDVTGLIGVCLGTAAGCGSEKYSDSSFDSCPGTGTCCVTPTPASIAIGAVGGGITPVLSSGTIPTGAVNPAAVVGDAPTATVGGVSFPTGAGLPSGTPTPLLTKVIRFLLYMIGAVAVLFLVYAGFQYILAGGDEAKAKDAKKIILYSIVGVLVALVSLILVGTLTGLVMGTASF